MKQKTLIRIFFIVIILANLSALITGILISLTPNTSLMPMSMIGGALWGLALTNLSYILLNKYS